jgi:Flp pilus assembly protein TadG
MPACAGRARRVGGRIRHAAAADVTLYLGGVEVSQGVSIDRKVTLTARTVADLVSQVASINNAGMNRRAARGTAVLSPYPTINAQGHCLGVKIDANSKVTVEWSDTLNGTARAKGSTVTIPGALVVPNTSLVWGEASYNYKPVVGYVLTGNLNPERPDLHAPAAVRDDHAHCARKRLRDRQQRPLT